MTDQAIHSSAGTVLSGDGSESQGQPKICGIVMPIAAMPDDYSLEHWRRVRKILERAVTRAGLQSQLVWENPEVDVIQSKILQNLYENDVVICDVSGLNPNVMLETGLRLSTKRPTVIVTDKIRNPPFDISTIGYIEYQRDLEYNAIEDFIGRLSKKISEVLVASEKGAYVSFVENYHFEMVSPGVVSVSSEEFLRERIEELSSIVKRIERNGSVNNNSRGQSTLKQTEENNPFIRVLGKLDDERASQVERELDALSDFHISHVIQTGIDEHLFVIRLTDEAKLSREEAAVMVRKIVRRGESR